MVAFSEDSGFKKNLMIGGLGVLIVGAVVLAVMLSGAKNDPRDTVVHTFKCVECGENVKITATQLIAASEQFPPKFEGAPMIMDCSKCGKKHCVYPTRKCDGCGEIFVPKYVRHGEELGMGANIDISNDACPKCGAPI